MVAAVPVRSLVRRRGEGGTPFPLHYPQYILRHTYLQTIVTVPIPFSLPRIEVRLQSRLSTGIRHFCSSKASDDRQSLANFFISYWSGNAA